MAAFSLLSSVLKVKLPLFLAISFPQAARPAVRSVPAGRLFGSDEVYCDVCRGRMRSEGSYIAWIIEAFVR